MENREENEESGRKWSMCRSLILKSIYLPKEMRKKKKKKKKQKIKKKKKKKIKKKKKKNKKN